jgi:hypothetical protein
MKSISIAQFVRFFRHLNYFRKHLTLLILLPIFVNRFIVENIWEIRAINICISSQCVSMIEENKAIHKHVL